MNSGRSRLGENGVCPRLLSRQCQRVQLRVFLMGQQGPARLDLRIRCFTMQRPHDEQLADGFVGIAIQGQRLKLNSSLAPFPLNYDAD